MGARAYMPLPQTKTPGPGSHDVQKVGAGVCVCVGGFVNYWKVLEPVYKGI